MTSFVMIAIAAGGKWFTTLLASERFLSSVSPKVHLEVAFLDEVHFAEGTIEVGHLVEVYIFLVELESRATRIWLIAA